MFNHFLARLDNNPVAPDGVLWPTFSPIPESHGLVDLRARLIGLNLSREHAFLRCLQLALLVEETPLAGAVRSFDQRVTYSSTSLQSRLQLGGDVVEYLGANPLAPPLVFSKTPTTPAYAAFTVTMTPSGLDVVDDQGRSRVTAITMVNGASNDCWSVNDTALFRIHGVAALGDSWQATYQTLGASWCTEALARVHDLAPNDLLSETATRMMHSPVSIDRLAAWVTVLGSRA
jgi:hypothetical protein